MAQIVTESLELVQNQTRSIIKEFHPKVVKIVLLRDSQTIEMR